MAVKTKSCCFPHAGGDVSGIASNALGFVEFSPRRWGCFYLADCLLDGEEVFPTQVGMFPSCLRGLVQPWRFPHAGGDVSPTSDFRASRSSFSPRRWGCFQKNLIEVNGILVFPTQVGMFLNFPLSFIVSREFSPRRWGCFHNQHSSVVRLPVFPTQVGMFPTIERSSVVRARFSPRRWGCFRDVIATIPTLTVFPTQVGMFPWL